MASFNNCPPYQYLNPNFGISAAFGRVIARLARYLPMMPDSKGQPWGPPDPTRELVDRRRPGRHDYENERLLRLLRNPSADPNPDSIEPAPDTPNDEPERFSLRAAVFAMVVFWGVAALVALML